jgi:3-oxoadipate enol-lactonase
MTQSAWIEVNGVSLRYVLSGLGDRVLVLVHEMGGSIESFDFIVDQLGTEFRVLRYDLRNAGLSERCQRPVTIDDLVADLSDLLAQLQIQEPAIVCGAALGAAICISFASQAPRKTAGIVLMAPASGLSDDRKAIALARADQVERQGVRPTADSRLVTSYPRQLREDPARFEDVRLRRLATDPFAIAAYTRLLAGLDLTAQMEAIRCPALVLAGRHDGDRMPDSVDQTTAAIQGRIFKVLETGHFMALQTPRIVSDEILSFATEHCFPDKKASAS